MAMKKKDLKKMSKRELLEIMLLQSKKIDELENEIVKMNSMLDDKKILLSNCGSIAEAALKLNNIFEAAQNAADQYLKNIELLSKEEIALRKSREEAEALKNNGDLVKETALLAIPVKVKKENIFKRIFTKIRGVFRFKKKNRRRKVRKIVIKEKRVSKPSKVLKFKNLLKRLKDGIKQIGTRIKNGVKTIGLGIKNGIKKIGLGIKFVFVWVGKSIKFVCIKIVKGAKFIFVKLKAGCKFIFVKLKTGCKFVSVKFKTGSKFILDKLKNSFEKIKIKFREKKIISSKNPVKKNKDKNDKNSEKVDKKEKVSTSQKIEKEKLLKSEKDKNKNKTEKKSENSDKPVKNPKSQECDRPKKAKKVKKVENSIKSKAS